MIAAVASIGWLLAATILQPAAAGVRILERGTQSYIDSPRQIVARTVGEFDRAWHAHAPDKPAPEVDFSREMVVGVFVGTRNTAGYSVDITGLDLDAAGVTVRYRENEPPKTGVVTAQILTSPYVFAAIPASAGQVRFEKVR